MDRDNNEIIDVIGFENCYLVHDTGYFLDPDAPDQVMVKITEENRLNDCFKIRFFEKWSMDKETWSLRKEILAYSIYWGGEREGEFKVRVLFTFVTDKSSLDYLNLKGYLKAH